MAIARRSVPFLIQSVGIRIHLKQWQIPLLLIAAPPSSCRNRGSVVLLWLSLLAMIWSVLLPFSQALLHVTATIKGLFTIYHFPMVWWGAETVLLSYVPDHSCLAMMSSQNGGRNGSGYIRLCGNKYTALIIRWRLLVEGKRNRCSQMLERYPTSHCILIIWRASSKKQKLCTELFRLNGSPSGPAYIHYDTVQYLALDQLKYSITAV